MKTTILFWLIAVSIPSVLVSYIEPARFSFVSVPEQQPAQTLAFALERAPAGGAPSVSAASKGSVAPLHVVVEPRAGEGRCAVNRACK